MRIDIWLDDELLSYELLLVFFSIKLERLAINGGSKLSVTNYQVYDNFWTFFR